MNVRILKTGFSPSFSSSKSASASRLGNFLACPPPPEFGAPLPPPSPSSSPSPSSRRKTLATFSSSMENAPPEHGLVAGSRADKRCSVEGMGSVIATVSGYHGRERFKLIKLITQTGAHYVGAMGRSTTHLVCWELKGNKYSLARSFGMKIVSHRWFEDCLKKGRRIPEGPYIMQSGKQVGSLSWELPEEDSRGKRKCPPNGETRNVLSDLSNTVDDARTPVSGSRSSRAEVPCSHPRCASTSRPAAQKRYIRDGFERSKSTERKGRRLRRKGTISEYFTYDVLDRSQGNHLTEIYGQQENNDRDYSDNLFNPEILGYSSVNDADNRSPRIGEVDDIEESSCFLFSNGHASEITFPSDETPPQNRHNVLGGNQNEEIKETDALPIMTGFLTPPELSCVICWTEFSSTRGILACGHRFCYSCIQEWANCMASKGKVSTCPLCKANFTSITKVEGAASSDQKIYSQTIPCSMSVVDLCGFRIDQDHGIGSQLPESVCHECHNSEPEDLLLCCHLCRNQWVHSCCLDPPVVPWTCVHCRDLRVLYQIFR